MFWELYKEELLILLSPRNYVEVSATKPPLKYEEE